MNFSTVWRRFHGVCVIYIFKCCSESIIKRKKWLWREKKIMQILTFDSDLNLFLQVSTEKLCGFGLYQIVFVRHTLSLLFQLAKIHGESYFEVSEQVLCPCCWVPSLTIFALQWPSAWWFLFWSASKCERRAAERKSFCCRKGVGDQYMSICVMLACAVRREKIGHHSLHVFGWWRNSRYCGGIHKVLNFTWNGRKRIDAQNWHPITA